MPALAAGFLFALSARAQRESVDLSDSWKFIKQDVAPDASFETWASVKVPHTWNALDGQNGKKADPGLEFGYYRGPAWYARKLDVPAAWNGRRIFLKFDAAALVTDVYLNGQHLGQHRGGFGAFVFEVTDVAKPGSDNLLRVKVDNSFFADVAPLSGDFTVFGGLYRPVHLFSTDPVCITPLYFGSPGVFLSNKKITPEHAVVEVAAHISNGTKAEIDNAKVQADLLDAEGKIVQTISAEAKLPAGETKVVAQTLELDHPHLWAGRPDPYLYSVQVKVMRDGKVLDEITQPLGLRTVQITDQSGFLLNGKPYALHGVNRHQELKDKGWALSPEDDDADFKLIAEIGATCLRLAHYQQNAHVHDLCDRMGLIVWEEVPVVEQVRETKEFDETTIHQFKEMILQDYNHPSSAFWGIFNELYPTWVKIKHPNAVPILTKLRDLAHELDPSRPVVAASFTAEPLPVHAVPDWQAFNTYPGWYWGKMDEMEKTFKKAAKTYGKQRTALSEYGAGANTTQHMEGVKGIPTRGDLGQNWKAEGQWHPEEYQTLTHITEWSQAKNNPSLWGTFVWAMFDFASDKRDESQQPGINDKGLVTHDRKIKKDAFYFYKSNWNPEPMVYIASRRNTPRKLAKTDVMVFSNTGPVELKVNGKSLGEQKPNQVNVATWPDVTLQPGDNQIEATSTAGGRKLTDTCAWTLAQ